jgi:hypothetical protein
MYHILSLTAVGTLLLIALGLYVQKMKWKKNYYTQRVLGILGEISVTTQYNGSKLLSLYEEFEELGGAYADFSTVFRRHVAERIRLAKDWKKLNVIRQDLEFFFSDLFHDGKKSGQLQEIVKTALLSVGNEIISLFAEKVYFYNNQSHISKDAKENIYKQLDKDAKFFHEYGIPIPSSVEILKQNMY